MLSRILFLITEWLIGLCHMTKIGYINAKNLQNQRKRFDIIQVFKILHKIDDIDMNVFFSFDEKYPVTRPQPETVNT